MRFVIARVALLVALSSSQTVCAQGMFGLTAPRPSDLPVAPGKGSTLDKHPTPRSYYYYSSSANVRNTVFNPYVSVPVSRVTYYYLAPVSIVPSQPVVIAPRLIACADKPEMNEVVWSCGGDSWRSGGDAASHPGLTSFDFIDQVLKKLANRNMFPNLGAIVVAGHSAGSVAGSFREWWGSGRWGVSSSAMPAPRSGCLPQNATPRAGVIYLRSRRLTSQPFVLGFCLRTQVSPRIEEAFMSDQITQQALPTGTWNIE